MKNERHLAVFDVHAPHHSEAGVNRVCEFAKEYKPDHFIIGGDFLNLEWASHWNDKMFKKLGEWQIQQWLKQEIEAGKDILARFRKAAGKKAKFWYIPGNHEEWLWYAVIYQNILQHPFNLADINFKTDIKAMEADGLAWLLKRELELDKLGIECLPYNKELKLHKITYLHGHQVSQNNSAKHYPGQNIVFGHHHIYKVTPLFNGGKKRNAIEHVACPALCNLSPGYLKNKSTRWLNGFWTADCQKNGLFFGQVRKILDGQLAPQ